MTERTINAGDWLEHEHYGRVRVAGFDEDGDPVFAVDRGTQYQCDLMSCFLGATRPLPGCTGWDWVEPVNPFVPRYFVPVGLPPWGTTERYVYVSDKDGNIECVYSDGRRKRQDISVERMAADARTWREIWESDAKAILMPTADEKWPKYFEANEKENAYIRCERNGCSFVVHNDETEEVSNMDYQYYSGRKQLIEAEAKARLTHPLSTCPDCGEFRGHGHEDVCPMAWVTQDLVNPRSGHDQVRWSNWEAGRWVNAAGSWKDEKHGFCDADDGSVLSVRCRRRDLPVQSVAEVCETEPVETIDVDPGEGYRWLEDCETVTPTDEIFMPDRNPMWVKPGEGPFRDAGYHGWLVRRAICRTEPAMPFGDAMQPPANRVPVRLFVPRRVMDEPTVDYPVRCCWSQSEIKDVATWVEVKHDQNGFYLER